MEAIEREYKRLSKKQPLQCHQFQEMYKISEATRTRRNLSPAMEWPHQSGQIWKSAEVISSLSSVRFGVGRGEDFTPRAGPAGYSGGPPVNNWLLVAAVFFTGATVFFVLYANFRRILSCSGIT